MYKDIFDTTVGNLISVLSEYPQDTKIVLYANRKGLFANIYPLNQGHGNYTLGVCDGQYKNTVYIELK